MIFASECLMVYPRAPSGQYDNYDIRDAHLRDSNVCLVHQLVVDHNPANDIFMYKYFSLNHRKRMTQQN